MQMRLEHVSIGFHSLDFYKHCFRNENEVHITTTVEKTRSVPSSPMAPRSNSDNIFVPGGQGYMKKIMAKADTLDCM